MKIALAETMHKQQQARFESYRALRFQVVASNYGRKFGWYVESEGCRLATLTDPQWDDMFWVSYAYSAASDAATSGSELDSKELWLRDDLIYRSRHFDMVAPFVLAAGAEPLAGRISMRGLYLSPPLTLLDRFLLRCRGQKY